MTRKNITEENICGRKYKNNVTVWNKFLLHFLIVGLENVQQMILWTVIFLYIEKTALQWNSHSIFDISSYFDAYQMKNSFSEYLRQF